MRVLENGDREYFWRKTVSSCFNLDTQFILKFEVSRAEMAKTLWQNRKTAQAFFEQAELHFGVDAKPSIFVEPKKISPSINNTRTKYVH